MNTPWSDPALRLEFDGDFRALVDFAAAARVPNGFGYLDADGVVDRSRPVEAWITARMTHVFSLAHMYGIPGVQEHAAHGVHSLLGPLRDAEHGGWFSAVPHEDGQPPVDVDARRKEAYAHAFVILAACSALAAGVEDADVLLDLALADQDEHWWQPEFGRVRESLDRWHGDDEAYRGINANMHTVEAYLAVFDATGERLWLDRARAILRFVHDRAAEHSWRIPEHYDTQWNVLPDFNADVPDHPFRPYGVTPGHAFEWARLMLHARAALLALGDEPGAWMLDGARNLFSHAVEDGWEDGAGGFVYTTDFDGVPVVRERMHWVLCEAVNAAVVLGRTLEAESSCPSCSAGERALLEADVAHLSELFAIWVGWADAHLREAPGRWIHELTPENVPGTRTWPGKPDAYHVAQMLLIPRLPVTPTFAAALRGALLEDVVG